MEPMTMLPDDRVAEAADRATTCGLFSWRPRKLQRFANPKIYLALYSLIGIIQGMTFSYVTVVLSTVERRFGIGSKEAAWIYSGNEFSQIFFVVFLPIVGRVKRRPLFMGAALALSAVGLFMMAAPHFVGRTAAEVEASDTEDVEEKTVFCDRDREEIDECNAAAAASSRPATKDYGSLVMIFSGIFIVGIGGSFYYVFGLPYGDDNSKKDEGPMTLGIIWASRLLGPALGYLLGAACIRVNEYPLREVDYEETDPRWFGAWWLGFPIIGVILLFFAPWFALFPQRLARKDTDAATIAEAESKGGRIPNVSSPKQFVKETLLVYRRLLAIPIYVLNLASMVTFVFGFIGYTQFFPKYLEFHYRQPASRSGYLGGLSKTVSAVAGCLLSGFIVGKFKLHARTLAAYCTLSGLISAGCFFLFIFLKCPPLDVVMTVTDSCPVDCKCSAAPYQPVCVGETNMFSPCIAGCHQISGDSDNGIKTFYDCTCASSYLNDSSVEPRSPASPSQPALNVVTDGYCPVDCNAMFLVLLALLFVVSFLGASTRMPNTLIMIRVICPKDKSASVSFIVVCVSLFGFLPAPFLYGALIDRSCAVWDMNCGSARNCLFYDTDMLRLLLNGATVIFVFISAVCDFGVFLLAKNLDLYDQAESDKKITSFSSSPAGAATTIPNGHDNKALEMD